METLKPPDTTQRSKTVFIDTAIPWTISPEAYPCNAWPARCCNFATFADCSEQYGPYQKHCEVVALVFFSMMLSIGWNSNRSRNHVGGCRIGKRKKKRNCGRLCSAHSHPASKSTCMLLHCKFPCFCCEQTVTCCTGSRLPFARKRVSDDFHQLLASAPGCQRLFLTEALRLPRLNL